MAEKNPKRRKSEEQRLRHKFLYQARAESCVNIKKAFQRWRDRQESTKTKSSFSPASCLNFPAPFKVEYENLNKKKLVKKKPTSVSSRVERHEKHEEVAMFLLDRWATFTHFCCFTKPVGQYLLSSFLMFVIEAG